jgi:hypothetical protein
MPAALLMRGHAHRGPTADRGWSIDWRECVDSHREFLMGPLAERFGGLHTFVCTYETPHRDAVLTDYRPVDHYFHRGESTQRKIMIAGLDLVLHDQQLRERYDYGGYDLVVAGGYDLVVAARFDMRLLCCPLDLPNFAPDRVNFLWREWNQESWEHHNRVPDCLHMLPGRLLADLRAAVADPMNVSEQCLHLIYRPLADRVGEGQINVMRGDYVNSNTDKMPNNVYKLVRA